MPLHGEGRHSFIGHKISKKGLEVDRAKIEVIERLEPPSSVKGIQSFLGHVGFYRKFIKDFSKIIKPLCNLLCTDHVFDFNADCRKVFQTLRVVLVSVPILCAPNWSLPFEVMCDASDVAVGTITAANNLKTKADQALQFVNDNASNWI
ncbi:MAG: RNase H-like domain-containing protein, partial [Sweet potato little leaf phytoplasma]|nr:RNase H-like domain-containing protein [Sweet potato little leaf phytoplasma]